MKKEDARVGLIIKKLRKVNGLSQMDLADRIGVSYQQIQKYEKGVSSLNIRRLVQIASALKAPVTLFFQPAQESVSEDGVSYNNLEDTERIVIHLFREIKNKKEKAAVIAFLRVLAAPGS